MGQRPMRPGTARRLAVQQAKPGGRGHDVSMMLDSLGRYDALTDGSVNYRVDAFERRR